MIEERASEQEESSVDECEDDEDDPDYLYRKKTISDFDLFLLVRIDRGILPVYLFDRSTNYKFYHTDYNDYKLMCYDGVFFFMDGLHFISLLVYWELVYSELMYSEFIIS